MKKHLIILLAVSLVTRFAFFGDPAETVFDEVHFGKFISGYFTGEYFFDIHPPLGKLIISGAGYLADFQPGFSFENIGQGFPDSTYLWLRLLPLLAGALLPLVIYLLAIRLGLSPIASFFAGILVALENSLLVQSRFILLDSFLLLFGFLALLFYFIYETKFHDTKYLLPAGVFAALAVSVKWTGATFWLIIAIIEIFKTISDRWMIKNWTSYLASRIMFLIIIPILIYLALFIVHFSLLTKSGTGDAFMSPEFRKTLVGSADYDNPEIGSLNIFKKFKELNLQMYKSNTSLTASHPYSSKWYTWPLMVRPIYYWNSSTGSEQVQSRIYLLGNPAVWWVATVALIYLVLIAFSLILKSIKQKTFLVLWRANNLPVFLVGSWIINVVPFIGISRALFLYHYLTALIFAILILAYLIDKLPNPAPEKDAGFAQKSNSPFRRWGKQKTVFTVIIAASFAVFIFFAPLTYGLPLTEASYNWRVWFNSWL